MSRRFKRVLLIFLLLIAVLAGAAVFGLHYATRLLKDQIVAALGPDSEVGEIVLDWSSVEIRQLRIKGPEDWPAEDALRAARIVVRPELRDLISAKVRIRRIEVEDAYLSVLRTRKGSLRLLPSLLEGQTTAETPASATPTAVSVDHVELKGGVLEFFDASVRKPAHKLRLEQVNAQVDNLQWPALTGRTQLALTGTFKGVQRDGSLAINGWSELATRDSDVTTKMRGVDLVALQPYLIKAAETGVRHGSLDLDVHSTVNRNHLHAPGRITLNNLELQSGHGFSATFMGMPRALVVSALKNKRGQISIHFTLDGNLNDPRFSLNENLSKRIAASMAEGLGISFEGVARGMGNAAQGLGGAMRKLFGK